MRPVSRRESRRRACLTMAGETPGSRPARGPRPLPSFTGPPIETVIIHAGEQPSFEEEFAQGVLEIITVFSARLYGARSRKHKQLLDTLTGPEAEEAAKQLSLV